MSDPNVTVTPAAPTVTVDPAAPKPPPAASSGVVTPAAPSADPEKDPQWLGARLERERKKVLADLGIEDVEDGKKAIEDLRKRREADKTASQKASEAEAALRAERSKTEELTKALATHAKARLGVLTDAQRAAVVALAGDDPAKQIQALETLAPTWAAQSASAGATTTLTTSTRPADTAPAPSAPKDGPATSPPDPKAVYAELMKTNPVLAARYGAVHGVHRV